MVPHNVEETQYLAYRLAATAEKGVHLAARDKDNPTRACKALRFFASSNEVDEVRSRRLGQMLGHPLNAAKTGAEHLKVLEGLPAPAGDVAPALAA